GALALRKMELRATADASRPARCHRLQPRIKVYPFRAIDAMRAENRGFPAAEAVKTHRHGNGDVDPDHADLDSVGKVTRGIAIAGEKRGAVGEGIGVDQGYRVFIALAAHHREHGTEDLVFINAHRGRNAIEQGAAQPEALLIALQ